MQSKIIIILILGSFLLINFGCEKNAGDDSTHSTYPIDISFTEIGKGALYGNGSENIPQQNIVITNQTQFNDLINSMNTVNNVSNSFTETNIDFNTYQIIAVFKEVKPTSWKVEITSVFENAENITILIIETENESTVITQPFHIIKIPKITKPIVFEQ